MSETTTKDIYKNGPGKMQDLADAATFARLTISKALSLSTTWLEDDKISIGVTSGRTS